MYELQMFKRKSVYSRKINTKNFLGYVNNIYTRLFIFFLGFSLNLSYIRIIKNLRYQLRPMHAASQIPFGTVNLIG